MDVSRLKRTSLRDRPSLVREDASTRPPGPNPAFDEFWQSLPGHLKVNDLKAIVEAVATARANRKPVIWMMGAHPIKVGLSRWIIQAMDRGIITALVLNGASIVHDFELAFAGTTSEDVAEALVDGSFGMTRETGEWINQWIIDGARDNHGLGASIGNALERSDFAHKELSIFAAAARNSIPVTVHVALGAEVFHHHPEASGEAIGKTSLDDFHSLCETVSHLGDGGVVLNVGSAVILPEVFLKALTVARNITGPIHNFTTANFDMIQHYRPNQNVVQRPVIGGGSGYSITGHHEIMIPLFLTALFSRMDA